MSKDSIARQLAQTIRAELTIGTFVNAANAVIPTNTKLVNTASYDDRGKGAAAYAYDSTLGNDYVTSHPRSSFINNGRVYRLISILRTIEMFGGGQDITDNGPIINQMIAEGPDRVMNQGSGSRVFYKAFGICFEEPGQYTYTTRIVVPPTKNCVFWCEIPGSVNLRYNGSDAVGIRYSPHGSQTVIGFDGVDHEGSDIAVIGSMSGSIIFRDCKLNHAKNKGLWFVDAVFYYDSDYPSIPVASISATSPARLNTTAPHGVTNGTKIGVYVKGGAEGFSGVYYAKYVDANNIDLYTDPAMTDKPFNGVGLGTIGTTIMTKGYTGPSAGAGINTVWVHFENLQIGFSAGHGIVVESSTYLLMTGNVIRFASCDKTPLVIDAAGTKWTDLEFQSINANNVTTNCYIHFPCRLGTPTNNIIDTVRFGPEAFTATVGATYATANYGPPKRMIVVGPLDGTLSANNINDLRICNFRAFGDNSGITTSTCLLDLNARSDNLVIDSGELRNLPSPSVMVLETHSAAGRTTGLNNSVNSGVWGGSTFGGLYFSSTAKGWTNYAASVVQAIKGPVVNATQFTMLTGMGASGTVVIDSQTNENMLRITITPGSDKTASVSLMSMALSYTRGKAVLPFIRANNLAAANITSWYSSAETANSWQLNSASSLVAGTAYKLIIKLEYCA